MPDITNPDQQAEGIVTHGRIIMRTRAFAGTLFAVVFGLANGTTPQAAANFPYSSGYYSSNYYAPYYSGYYSSSYYAPYYSGYYRSSYYYGAYYPVYSSSYYSPYYSAAYYPAYYSSYYYPPVVTYYSPSPTAVYVAPAYCPSTAVQALPYAKTTSAPASQTQEPPFGKSALPTVIESRNYAADGTSGANKGNGAAQDACKVGFWNVSDGDVKLYINGKMHMIPRNRNLTLTVTREFTYQINAATPKTERVPDGNTAHEIVIR
jgi:hypothetical protein